MTHPLFQTCDCGGRIVGDGNGATVEYVCALCGELLAELVEGAEP